MLQNAIYNVLLLIGEQTLPELQLLLNADRQAISEAVTSLRKQGYLYSVYEYGQCSFVAR